MRPLLVRVQYAIVVKLVLKLPNFLSKLFRILSVASILPMGPFAPIPRSDWVEKRKKVGQKRRIVVPS